MVCWSQEARAFCLFAGLDNFAEFGGRGGEALGESRVGTVLAGVHDFEFAGQHRAAGEAEGTEDAGEFVGGGTGGHVLFDG